MRKILQFVVGIAITGVTIYAFAQFVPPAVGAYISNGSGGWTPASTTATAGAIGSIPPAQAIYCFNSSTGKWVPADSSCFGSGSGGGTVTSVATSSPISGGTFTTSGTISCPTCTVTIASGTSALGTGAISSATCATVVTTTATGVASTDSIIWTPNASIKAVTGYAPSTSGGLTIAAYPTSGNVNFDVCNWSSGSITPGAVTLNWRVVR